MQVGVLATDGGPHTPEKWAAVTAGQIVQIGADASGKQAVEARRLELGILEVLEDAHHGVMKHERGKIAEHGHERLSHDLDPSDHVVPVIEAILKVCASSPWALHFEAELVKDYIENVLRQHFATVMDIERSWHADGSVIGPDHKPTPNPTHDHNNEHVQAFRARRVRGN